MHGLSIQDVKGRSMMSVISFSKVIFKMFGIETSGFSELISGIVTVRRSRSIRTMLDRSASESSTEDVSAPQRYGNGASIALISCRGSKGTNVFTKFNGSMSLLRNSQHGEMIEGLTEMSRTFRSNKIDSQAATNMCGENMDSGIIFTSLSLICSAVLKSSFTDPELNCITYVRPQLGKIGVSQSVSSWALIDLVSSAPSSTISCREKPKWENLDTATNTLDSSPHQKA